MTASEGQARWDSLSPAQRDGWVAERVMGWTWRVGRHKIGSIWYAGLWCVGGSGTRSKWHPTTDHNHAHEALATFDVPWEYRTWRYWKPDSKVWGFGCEMLFLGGNGCVQFRALADTAPAAISLACIMAMECRIAAYNDTEGD